MAEQQVENTQQKPQETNVSGTENTEQVQSTETQETVQPKVEETDLSKIDLTKATPEQLAELQQGYMRQADYTKKTQEIAESRKQPLNYAEVVQTPEFLEWAKQVGAVAESGQPKQVEEPEFMQSFTDEQKQALAYHVKQTLQPYVQSFTSQTIAQQDEKLKNNYSEVFTPDVQQKMNSLQRDIIKNKGAMFRDELFKIHDYNSATKRAFEAGKQEGLKGKQIRQQANLPPGTPQQTTSQVYSPNDTRRIKLQKSFERAEKDLGVKAEEVLGR